ncbi:phosphatidylinositol 3- and 4-kinase domain-containing protein [Sarocladium implicatum]|nr:phosphatidylinositol 3- and 4-kinase domain-containing protein [Sarocladium implicatum]
MASHKSVVSLIGDLKSGSIKDREKALDELGHAFNLRSRSANIDEIGDKIYHDIFDAIFHFVLREKPSFYDKRKKETAARSVATRLTKCSSLLRVAVARGAPKLGRKTLLALIDHITQVLPGPDDEYMPPLLQDYIKALNEALAHPSHVELLARKEGVAWETCVDFLLTFVTKVLPDNVSNEFVARGSPAPGSRFTARTSSATQMQRKVGQLDGGPLRDALQSLHHLVTAVNAPLVRRSHDLSELALKVLGVQHFSMGAIQTLSFSIFNEVFSFIQTDDLTRSLDMTQAIIPPMSYWWRADKVSQDELIRSLRNEISRTLLLVHHYLENVMMHSEAALRREVEDLADVLWLEYSKRSEAFRLQLSDIAFASVSSLPQDSLSLASFGLRPYNESAEGPWIVLQNLALLESLLVRSKATNTDDEMHFENQPRKRRRIEQPPSRLRSKLLSSDLSTKRTAIQLLSFIMSRQSLQPELLDNLDTVAQLAGDKDAITASWALIACGGYASSIVASHSRHDVWKQVWHVGARGVSHPATSRASCFLLARMLDADVLPYSDVREEVTTIITSADVNGPAVLSDSAIFLISSIFHIRNTKVPNASRNTCSQVIRWLFLRWNPVEHSFAAFQSAHVQPLDLVNLLRRCCGSSLLELAGDDRSIGSLLGETWRQQSEIQPFTEYLLLLPRDASGSPRGQTGGRAEPIPVSDSVTVNASKKLISELLLPKVEELADLASSWTIKAAEGGKLVSLDRFSSLISACLVLALLLPQIGDIPSSPSASIESSLSELLQSALTAAFNSVEPDTFASLSLRLVRPVLPRLNTSQLELFCKEQFGMLRLLGQIYEALQEHDEKPTSSSSAEVMDLDDEFESQASKSGTQLSQAPPPRRNIALRISSSSFYSDTRMRLGLLAVLQKDPSQSGLLPDSYVDQLVDLPDEELLRCQQLIVDVCRSDLTLSPMGMATLIERLGAVVSEPKYQCSEVALTTCIDALEGLHQIWLHDADQLSDMVGDLYNHFVKTCLTSNIFSPRTQTSLAQLILTIIKVDPDYSHKLGLDSCRTTLLRILTDGNVAVKFFLAKRISSVFEFSILMLHDEIFLEVLDSLPTDSENISGIALRMLVLHNLACSWPTLLRRCTYHIFEIPGKIPHSIPYATRCLDSIATTLRLGSPKELFGLFARQLLYTWLDEASLASIPFSIFGFESLGDLLQTAQAEAIGLMVMREQNLVDEKVTHHLGMSEKELLLHNFATALAYSMVFVAANSSQKGTGEDEIKEKIGNSSFVTAVQVNFIDIIALLLDSIDQEEPVERVFSRHPDLAYAAEIMVKIKGLAHSSVILPPNQQPMFRPKYVIHELFRLCQWTEFQFEDLWTPATVVAIARQLINTVHPALGSLHACSVLRKLRILICLAGSVALESYPLEMLLTSVRTFIMDSECVDDALGISQYLVAEGSHYLADTPSFLAGYALSTLASLRVFLESSQASTTQESQFKATMDKAQNFHAWLSKYLTRYKSDAFDSEEQKVAFQAITRSASQIRASGNAEKDTPEAMLLLSILTDEAADARLLNDPSRHLALKLLCSDFTIPARNVQDVIESDEDAKAYSSALWTSCNAQQLSDSFLAWAGRVLGKAFASSGEIPDGVLKESNLSQLQGHALGVKSSELGILGLLQDLTANPDSRTAGLAEAALRTAVSQALIEDDTLLVDAFQRALDGPLFTASQWGSFHPIPSDARGNITPQQDDSIWHEPICAPDWVTKITAYMVHSVYEESIVLRAIAPVIAQVKGFAEKAFPFIVHLVLLFQLNQRQHLKLSLSDALKSWLVATESDSRENVKLLLNTILYLRAQALPEESSIADRLQWLDVDFAVAAAASARCGLHKTALLFSELVHGAETGRSSRRSSTSKVGLTDETLLAIFENIDDPDAYYGIPEQASLSTVLARVEHESEGTKSLAFRGAQYDSHLRLRRPDASFDGQALAGALNSLGLSGLSYSLLQHQPDTGNTAQSVESTFRTARKLEIWNLPAPAANDDHSVVMYKVFQNLSQAPDIESVKSALHDGLSRSLKALVNRSSSASVVRSRLSAMASLAELDALLDASSAVDSERILKAFDDHAQWMKSGSYDDVSRLLSCRGTSLSMVSQHASRLHHPKLSVGTLKQMEVQSLLLSSTLYRYHQATQESLNLATTLTDLIKPCEDLGLHVDAAVNIEAANSLWDFGEISTSIRMLQAIDRDSSLRMQTLPVSRSDLLSKLGHQVSIARLEKPQDIQRKYLQEALRELKGNSQGKDAGQVFHQFAVFCDEQLQDPASLEDLTRLQNLRKGKSDEVAELKVLISNTRDTQSKNRYNHILNKEKQWLALDEKELQRVETVRAEFSRLSLENYLLSLTASDDHNNDALRFTALWLERSSEDAINKAVSRSLLQVPTRKFAGLMNQLTSRLQNQDNYFQKLLMELVYNICVDHPYHGMYQIWSGTKAKAVQQDEIASLRVKATEKVAQRLANHRATGEIWVSIDKTSKYYHGLAMDRNSTKYKSGAKMPIKESPAGHHLVNCLAKYRIPPPTMDIELSATKDYSQVPIISKLDPTMSIASGVSAPKIITAIASDGAKYKQLVKGGHDDLRQDAIMEQVFAAVSSLLKGHRATRQRSLGIRTYKVLPLTATSGLIEFVPNTIPLHEFLMPAHERYYPRDYKGSQCRKEIFNVQTRSQETRVATFRKVTERFHPVMRYFFMEYFIDPDEWFARRSAYTRSTAAISMLGHVLGLGDRHGHNILLDTKTGEAVHIDLGVAFEAGRILPVPELVPFRLTRDIVDGMGITKTEGVFRRCCEFTLDALRDEQYSIMTILDVLRYDPLYSWTVSPLRIAKLQKSRNNEESNIDDAEQNEAELKGRKTAKTANEPSEAERALEVVRKKLSKTLSVAATVNDLINQAMDEQNLAVLYSGWAAYA